MNRNSQGIRSTAISGMLLCAAVILLLFAVRPVQYPVQPDVAEVRTTIAKTGRVVHACGFLETADGERVAYTNSYDALTGMYEQGNRVCEIDIREAGDGELICAHGSESFLADGMVLPPTATEKDFLSSKIYDEFHPMNVDMLAQFMREHKDLLVITDIRGDNEAICRKIAEKYPDLMDQFVVQFYHEDEYKRIAQYGFRHLIYTLYRAEDYERNLWRIHHYAETHELVGVTIQCDQFQSWKNRLAMIHCGVPMMFHTVDDQEEIAEMLSKPYVLGVYTNLTAIDY